MTDNSFLPYTKHTIEDLDIQAVIEALQDDLLTGGTRIPRFEADIAKFCGAKHAACVSSGTAGLHLANLALSYPPGSKVVVPAITFAATVNSVLYAGGTPLLCDVDPDHGQMTVESLSKLMKEHTDIVAAIPVHLGGRALGAAEIYDLCRSNRVTVIEDACHSYGGKYSHEGALIKVGDGTHADLSVLSFHGAKLICTGEGGAVTTNSEAYCERIRQLRNHGIVRDPSALTHRSGDWYYEVQGLGFNYRMTDFQAALGSAQLQRAARWIDRRRDIVCRYAEAFAELDEIEMEAPSDKDHVAYHLAQIKVHDRDKLFNHLRGNGIHAQVHYVPINYHPHFQVRLGVRRGQFPGAESYYSQTLSLPLFPALEENDQRRVIDLVIKFFRY